jgi:hypothetical protein
MISKATSKADNPTVVIEAALFPFRLLAKVLII